MAKLIRHEFLGNRWLVLLLFLNGVGIPIALIYIIETTLAIEEEVDDPSKLIEALRAGTE